MKKPTAVLSILIVTIFLLLSNSLHADEIDRQLGTAVSETVRENIRQMVSVGIPEAQALQMVRTMARNRFSEQNMIRAQKTVIETQAKGLPVEPVMNKAMEGLAKGVAADNIVRAMEQVQQRYAIASRHAAAITENEPQRQRLRNTVADCLSAGITNGDLNRLMTQLQQQTRQLARNQIDAYALATLQAARTMARMSVASTAATDVVCQALRQRYTAQEMRQLNQQFMAQAMDMSPNRVANQYAQAIAKGQRGDSLGKSGAGGQTGGPGGPGGSSGGAGVGSGGGSGGSGAGGGGGHGRN
jgi:hypothetical protein